MTGDISLEKQFCEYLDRGDSQKAGLLVPELSAAARAPDGTSLLFKVIEKGTPDVLLQLLTKGFSLNVRDAKGNTLLIQAIRAMKREHVEVLIENGADVNLTLHTNDTPLLEACRLKMVDIARKLLPKNKTVNVQNQFGMTALHYVAEIGDEKLMEEMMALGGVIDRKNKAGKTPIDIADDLGKKGMNDLFRRLFVRREMARNECFIPNILEKDDVELMRAIIAVGGNIKERIGSGRTYLWLCHSGKMALVLAEGGIDIQAICEKGQTALHHSVEHRKNELVETLLKMGLDPNQPDHQGQTPFILAGKLFGIHRKEDDLLLEILRRGGGKNIEASKLLKAVIREDFNAVNDCLISGDDPNQKDSAGRTPMHTAAKRGNAPIIEALISRGGKPTVHQGKENSELWGGREGYTPLHHAVAHGHFEAVRALLKGKADPNARDKFNVVPLHLVPVGRLEIIDLLCQGGANLNATGLDGSALHKAAVKNDLGDLASLLISKNLRFP